MLLIWVVLPLTENSKTVAAAFILITFLYMFFSHRSYGESPRAIGWRTDNFTRALRPLAVFTVAAALILLFIGAVSVSWLPGDAARPVRTFAWMIGRDSQGATLARGEVFWRYTMLLSGIVQQYFLQGFINRRAAYACGDGWRSIAIVATVFALLHLPNLWLMSAAFVGGAVWAYIYQRIPNLYALALSHLVMTWLLIATLPPAVLRGLRVGFRYFA